MNIAQISDTHLLSLQEHDPAAQKRADNLVRCVDAINAQTPDIAAVVHTGDMVNVDDQNGYGLAREILSSLRAPFFPTVGNRDQRSDLINAFLAPDILASDAPFCQYRISLGGLDLVSVDTKSDTRRIGTSCTARLEQLDELLARDTQKPVIPFLHHPPTPVETLINPLQFETLEHAKAFSDLFDRYDNIVHILCGHTHRSDIFKLGRHTASTLPSLATDVRLDSYPTQLAHEPVFQIHQLHEDMTLTSASQFALAKLAKAA